MTTPATERDTLAEVMRQVEIDLRTAHTEICKLQKLDPTRPVSKATTPDLAEWCRSMPADAANEIERLRKIQKRLDGLAMSACGHIANKGIADDFRKNITLCQRVDL